MQMHIFGMQIRNAQTHSVILIIGIAELNMMNSQVIQMDYTLPCGLIRAKHIE